MSKGERGRLRLIRDTVRPARIHELQFAVVSESEWAASVAIVGGQDRRFRFTGGRLFDEAAIGDARVQA